MNRRQFKKALTLADVTQYDWFDNLINQLEDKELKGYYRHFSSSHNSRGGEYNEEFKEEALDVLNYT